jgi:predicted cobalt transporter CbtA
MSKALELIGFALIGGTIYSFVGMANDPLRWPVFWGCAGGALAIIIYNRAKRKRKQA